MYLIKISSEFCGSLHVFVNLAGFRRFTWILPLRILANYQKPWYLISSVIYIFQNGDLKFASGDYISTVSRQKATWGFF